VGPGAPQRPLAPSTWRPVEVGGDGGRGSRVPLFVDLSADMRFDTSGAWAYGMPERPRAREALKARSPAPQCRLLLLCLTIAHCPSYSLLAASPTPAATRPALQMALLPLLSSSYTGSSGGSASPLWDPSCKPHIFGVSGYSGAGRRPATRTTRAPARQPAALRPRQPHPVSRNGEEGRVTEKTQTPPPPPPIIERAASARWASTAACPWPSCRTWRPSSRASPSPSRVRALACAPLCRVSHARPSPGSRAGRLREGSSPAEVHARYAAFYARERLVPRPASGRHARRALPRCARAAGEKKGPRCASDAPPPRPPRAQARGSTA